MLERKSAGPRRENQELWALIGTELSAEETTQIMVTWCKGHATAEHVENGVITEVENARNH